MDVYCSKQHVNPSGNRFCTQCGEPLPLPEGEIISNRYRIIRLLGQGGFGRTYLAEDSTTRQNCVLKEFAPQVEKPEDLKKAKELFDREAKVLQKLQHPQIPRFHTSLQAKLGSHDFFFLVQDFVAGENLWDLLEKRQGKGFSEEEIVKLLRDILPVLGYIHSQDVVHRDISPDNLMLRDGDNVPVLIDFGGVKQLPASQGFWMTTQMPANRTLLGKKGYAPEEQLRQGKAFPSSDLYSLAVTSLVLLTGKEPQDLYDSFQGTWRWGNQIKVSKNLENVLKKMLSYKPSDRYLNAEVVIKDLQGSPTPAKTTTNPNITKIKTMLAAPGINLRANGLASRFHNRTQIAVAALPMPMWMRPFAVSLLGTSAVVLTIGGIWALGGAVVQGVSSISLPQLPTVSLPSFPGGEKSQEETKSKTTNSGNNILTRRQQLAVPEGFFNNIVNSTFHSENPDLQGRALTGSDEDRALRQEWVSVGDDILKKIEQANLSDESRQKLGRFGARDYEIWEEKANTGKLGKYSIRQLDKDTNREFDNLFPGQRRGKLDQKTYAQIWYAIASDKVSKLEAESK
ncbi:serine/threonine-protein kinase [Calothrix sp. PCC 6303]|uniref:serine/threonine-protein kinase n=1 Tax=Calothrix sp. PCC 6303 TaxID=1170562 RepID=UPI0005A13309|nr:serine/threonine-protein kinase [Calothrix sp. PCC 6303]